MIRFARDDISVALILIVSFLFGCSGYYISTVLCTYVDEVDDADC